MVKRSDSQTFKNEDLLLKVTEHVDASKWDESRYEAFFDELCGERYYQKDALRTVLRYLLGGRYQDLRALARENFEANEELQRRHGSVSGLESVLQLPDQLACSIDLATGTGKSYVLYGLAVVLLAEGVVDKVLVLCPSNTIETGLFGKFRELSGNADLRASLPSTARVHTPRIINAGETITDGSICVENYHAILKHVKSSITDSLKGQGHRTAIFSDEAHHLANETRGISEWKKFVLDPEFGFRIHVGVTGTPYVRDDYFSDVVSRYSLRQAMEDRFVKRVEYATDMPATGDPEEYWQLIYNKHQDIRKKLKKRNLKPLTIIVTRDVASCKRIANELQGFLEDWAKYPADKAAAAVLCVTSAAEHQPNVAKLSAVDTSRSPVEWIVSVSMLSEGWDVKNVFQIVPSEERAFNSKLLIAQVLGRGLRVPEGWTGEPPMLTVFNHDAWSARIRHLVDEILEIEKRLSAVIVEKSAHHFELHNLDYDREQQATESTKKGEYKLLERGYVELPTQVETIAVEIEFERALTAERTKFQTSVSYKTFSIEEVAERMYRSLRAIDDESCDAEDPDDRTNYSAKFPMERCAEIVRESLKRASISSDRITDETRQKFLAALGTLRRKGARRVVYTLKPKVLSVLTTAWRQAESCGAADLRRKDKTIFYTVDTGRRLPEPMMEFFKEVTDTDGEYAGAAVCVSPSDFKTGLNLVIAEATPEKKFVRGLCERKNALALDAWMKNTSQRFYAIEYAWKKGTYAKRGDFSPDFFIKVSNLIFVIEIKGDEELDDPSVENRKKYEYAARHFEALNVWLASSESSARYQLNFVTPKDYPKFFQQLREGNLWGFKSQLDIVLGARVE